MNIKIHKVLDRGVPQKERLWLKVLADVNLTSYAVVDTTYTSEDTISNLVRHFHWFESKNVRAGDTVVLYTKPGTSSETKNKDGSTTYFFFWGLENTIWNKQGDCAVLFEINSWETSPFE